MALEGLLARARLGERDALDSALEALFRAHRRSVLALCRSLTRDASEAEDALQETFIAARGALPAFRGDASASTWLHRIAVRVALKVRVRRPDVAEVQEASGADPSDAHLHRDALTRALDQLSPEQRAVLALFAVQGLTHAEIAEILGVPEGTVWSRLHVARKRLAELLRD